MAANLADPIDVDRDPDVASAVGRRRARPGPVPIQAHPYARWLVDAADEALPRNLELAIN
jgi:hypothetical protein